MPETAFAAHGPLRSAHEIEFAIGDTRDRPCDSALFLPSLQGLEPGPTPAGLVLAVPVLWAWALWAAGLVGLLGACSKQAGDHVA